MVVSQELIDQCRRQDEKACYELYYKCYSMIMSVTTRYVLDKTEQPLVANQSFVRIINGLKTFDTSRDFGAWAYRIAINTNLDYLRQQKRLRQDNYEDDFLELSMNYKGQTSINYADLHYEAEELLDMINQLPPRTAQVFNLFAIDGFSHEEISKELNMSTGTTKWHVSKARERLQALLANQVSIKNKWL